ncbi:M23 family metallopeptidase, partial [Micromonospora zhanjiangensis]
ANPPTGTPTGSADTSPPGTTHGYAFPVRSADADYHPTHAGYPGTDIFAACGSPVVAVTDGTVLEVSLVDRFDERGPKGPFNGGRSVSLLGDDGVRYYGSHLSVVTTGVTAGTRVRAGQQVGQVGRTGNASNVCHLHFGISPPCGRTGDWWIRRGVVWPAPYLDAWRRKATKSPAVEVAAWERGHGCPKAPPA